MRISDLFLTVVLFGTGVVAGVFLCEADLVTGTHIKTTTKKVVDKFRKADEPAAS